jgi:hypothetical protein
METWRMPGTFPTEDDVESAPDDQNLTQLPPQPNTPKPRIIGCVSLTKDTDDTALVEYVFPPNFLQFTGVAQLMHV